MNKVTNLVVASMLVASVAGCGGKDNEPRTYGVRDSKWSSMSVAQRKEAKERYEHEIRVSERRKVEEEMLAQKEKDAKLVLEERVNNLEKKQQYAQNATPTTVIIQQPQAPQQVHTVYQQVPVATSVDPQSKQ